MAEDKNTVVVYRDWLDKFEALTDEEAGRLIKHFFRYVNDLNPEFPDRITQISFLDIKKTLQRDLRKWEKSIEKKSESGQIGNLKRWNTDLYELFQSGKMNLETALNIAESRKVSQPDKVRQNESHDVAKIAVSVSVNDSVNVSGSVNDIHTISAGEEKNLCVGLEESGKSDLINALVKEFGFDEERFSDKKRIIFAFVTVLYANNNVDHFISQMRDYKEYKKVSGEKWHSFKSLIGTQEQQFKNGAWEDENWADKTEKFKQRQNGSAAKPGIANALNKMNQISNPHQPE